MVVLPFAEPAMLPSLFISHGSPMLAVHPGASGQALQAAPRLLLHATRLALPHPATGTLCEWHSPAPF